MRAARRGLPSTLLVHLVVLGVHAGLRQFWAGLGRSHQGVGAVSTSFQPFFVEEDGCG